MPIWASKILSDIIHSNFAQLELIVLPEYHSRNEDNQQGFGFSLVNHVYRGLIERNTYQKSAIEIVDYSSFLEDYKSIEIQQTKIDKITQIDYSFIKQQKLDLIIQLGTKLDSTAIASSARFGLWSFNLDMNFLLSSQLQGFRESITGEPVTEVKLETLTKDNIRCIIATSYSCTDTSSVQDNISTYFWKAAAIMPRKLKYLYNNKNNNSILYPTSSIVSINASNNNINLKEYSVLVLKKILGKVTVLYNNYFGLKQWILMYAISDVAKHDFTNYHKIIPPKDRFWADPHIIQRDGKYYIYIEEVLYKNRKGHISLIEMDENGNYQPPKKIIEHDYHMSYPHIVEYENDYYMIPETAENETISIYKCVQFPDKWEFQIHLMKNIKAYDATLLYKDKLWWLFANVVESDGISSWDELFIFSSPALLSEQWKPHTQNPVISDCRSSRPAGKIFEKNGRIYRPSQNSSIRYGYGLKINEIIELNQEKYEERLISEALPDWDSSIIGLHTFNREGNLNIIDAIYKRKK